MEMDLMADDFSILTAGGAENSLKKQVRPTDTAPLSSPPNIGSRSNLTRISPLPHMCRSRRRLVRRC